MSDRLVARPGGAAWRASAAAGLSCYAWPGRGGIWASVQYGWCRTAREGRKMPVFEPVAGVPRPIQQRLKLGRDMARNDVMARDSDWGFQMRTAINLAAAILALLVTP